MDNRLTHFKDKKPQQTVAEIRALLYDKDISVIEKEWYGSEDCYHSLTLEVESTPFAVNGKGVTPSFALASAYGEMMERLQNMSSFKLMYDLSQQDSQDHRFHYAPDEKVMTTDDLLAQNGPWLRRQTALMADSASLLPLMQKWQSVLPANTGFVCLPFYHVNSRETDEIPVIMLSKMYTTNGMAAGNTMEEALVQGISEIFERYAAIQILKNRISPPAIPRDVIQRSGALSGMTKAIESSDRYTLYFKDCSLGIGLPVVAVLCVDNQSGKYFVKFGAHPIFDIAVERTLTELLQGQNINQMKGMRPYHHNTQHACGKDNIYAILINGCGDYPYAFFAQAEDYPYTPFKDGASQNNKALLRQMTAYIFDKGWDLFVRDVSFLGFPSCQIIIPGLSEVDAFNNLGGLSRYASFRQTKTSFAHIVSLTKPELAALAEQMDSAPYLKNTSPAQWLHLDPGACPWVYHNTYWLVAALYILADEPSKSAGAMREFMTALDKAAMGKDYAYFRCAAAYLAMIADGIMQDQVVSILRTFYPQPMIEAVILDFSKDNLLSLFAAASRPNACCDTGHNHKLVSLYHKLKTAYLQNTIDQQNCAQFFLL